ncbi:hemerythrin domain-containing protein [Chloroflexota bacterium]
MTDYISIIEEIIKEHQVIRGYVKLVGESTSDREAMLSIKSVSSEWAHDGEEVLSQMLGRLKQTVYALNEGLKNHFAKEEKYLPPVLGELLMRALLRTHDQIRAVLKQVGELVSDTRLEGLSPDELKARELAVKQMINNLTDLIDSHADKEEQLLGLVMDALRA